jgi:DNA (cytosine-5)-methyltransferase 1
MYSSYVNHSNVVKNRLLLDAAPLAGEAQPRKMLVGPGAVSRNGRFFYSPEDMPMARKLKYGSLFTGVGGFDLGFDQAGMECVWQVEKDERCRQVLERHWPSVRRYTDVRDVGARNLEPVDIVTGGFPCQDLSVAGKRGGLAGERSGLWFEFHRVVAELKPGWVVIENVPGLLSSNEGCDFAAILSGLAECGYLSAWRILDAQYFGLAQRRKRVFIVASLGNGNAAKVLLESEGGCWNPAPSRETRPELARDIAASLKGGSGERGFPAEWEAGLTTYAITERTRADGRNFEMQEELAYALTNPGSGGRPHSRLIAFGGNNTHGLSSGVRRLTPVECERLQGFPDGHTAGQSDSSRYRQLGNAVAVPVARWIGRQLVKVYRS